MELYIENPLSSLKLPLYIEENTFETQSYSMLKLILMEEGSGVFDINGQKLTAAAPILFCLNNREDLKVIKNQKIRTRIIYFSPAMVNTNFNIENIYGKLDGLTETTRLDHFYFIPFIDRDSLNDRKLDIGPNTYGRLSSIIDTLKLQTENYKDRFWPCRNRSYLIELLLLVSHLYSESLSSSIEMPEAVSDIHDILLFIQLNYNTKITIQDITTQFHTNRNTLSRKFKEETGLSVMEYIVRLRIKIACTLLRDTSLPVSEIMERVGFTEASYWGRTFKKLTGVTPMQYRDGSSFFRINA